MTNYFDYFGIPVSPDVDEAALKRTFYANSKRFHPDFHTLDNDAAQEEALEQSTLNNQGYKVLTDGDLRLKHFLDVHGALGAEGENKVPQDFLMDIMEVNEALMELEFDDDPLARRKVAALIDGLEAELEADVQDLRSEYDPASPSPRMLDAFKDYYLKRRYLLRLRQKI